MVIGPFKGSVVHGYIKQVLLYTYVPSVLSLIVCSGFQRSSEEFIVS